MNYDFSVCQPHLKCDMGWILPKRLQDQDHAAPLAEAFFSMVCIMVTELPSPPPLSIDGNDSLKSQIRRELVHALAAEPRSYSKAMEAASNAVTRNDESSGAGIDGSGSSFRTVFADISPTY